jgi:hypothetical protein
LFGYFYLKSLLALLFILKTIHFLLPFLLFIYLRKTMPYAPDQRMRGERIEHPT